MLSSHLINIINTQSKYTQCKNNSNPEKPHDNCTRGTRISNMPCAFSFNPFVNKFFIMFFTIFSIVMPIGIQPQLLANYAFAEINSQMTNDEDEYTVEGEMSSYSSTSETKPELNVNNPFGSGADDNKKAKLNIIIPDIVESDLPGTQPSSTASSHQIDTQPSPTTNSHNIGSHSIKQVHPNSMDQNSSNVDNVDGNITIEKDKTTTAELSSIDSQIGTLNNNESNNVNEVNSIVSDDKPGTENLQSQLTSQPRSKSYRDYIENSNANKNNDNVIISDDKVGTELSTTNSGINSVIGNANHNANEDLVVPGNQSNTNQSQSIDSQSQLTSQPRYKSYRDYIENNNASNQSINITSDTQATELSSIDSQIGTVNSNVNANVDEKIIEKNYQSTIQSGAISEASSQISAQSSNEVYGDFNGDGRDDVAIGVPFEDVDTGAGSIEDAGAVNVLYGSSTGLSATTPIPDQFWTQNTGGVDDLSEPFDGFGSSLTSGDFNGDGKDDLAIGVPFEFVETTGGTVIFAGAVNVLYGSSSGLSATSPLPDQFWTQNTAGVVDLSEANDNFGASLSTGDFNGDGKDDLAIGVPEEDVDTTGGTRNDAGAVNVLYGSSTGLSATSPIPDQYWTQSSPNVNDLSEIDDNFGYSLSSGDINGDGRDDLAIGVPFEEVVTGEGTFGEAGAVNVLYGSSTGLSATSPIPDQYWTQSTKDVNDRSEPSDFFGSSLSSGDFNGDGKDDLAIGVRAEDVNTGAGTFDNAGAVNVLYGSSTGLSDTSPIPDQYWTQSSPNVNDLSEVSDVFGWSLSSGDFNGDGKDDLAIGVPREGVNLGTGSITEAGTVNVLYGSSKGLSATSPQPDQFWTQSTAHVNDLSESGDQFGVSCFSGDFNGDGKDDLAIGVPFEEVDTGVDNIDNAGAVNVLYGSSTGLSDTSPIPDQYWTQSTAHVNDLSELDDDFGTAIG
jgi:FG-GAP repeat